MLNYLKSYLTKSDIHFKEHESIAAVCSVRIGSVADIIVYPKTQNDLLLTLKYLQNNRIQYLIQGRFTNSLFRDNRTSVPIICTSHLCGLEPCGDGVICESGVSLPMLASVAVLHGLSGLEPLSGIPGSLGASVVGNAGAFGREISDLVESVTVYDTVGGTTEIFSPRECGFAYRESALSPRYILLSCRLRLSISDRVSVRNESLRIKRLRRDSQPTDKPSLGSVFRRCELGSAAALIDSAGLKGAKIGGCEISQKHAGFIINTGGGRAEDYIGLMYLCRKSVFEKYGVLLTPEIKII